MGMADLADWRDLKTENVYEPAEDSYLLVEATTPQVDSTDRVLDVGCGSGVVGAEIAASTGARVVGVDRNPFACRATRDRGVPVVCGDLVAPFGEDEFDVVVFNPPYLPTNPNADDDDWREVAVGGGPQGRAVIERFLGDVDRVITPDGRVFLLVSTVTGVESVVETAAANGFNVVAIADTSFPYETLTVLKLVR